MLWRLSVWSLPFVLNWMMTRSVCVLNVLVAEWLHSSLASSCEPLLWLFTLEILSTMKWFCMSVIFFRFISVYDFIPIKFNCALTIDIVGKQVYWNPEKLQIINEQAWSDNGKKELWDGMEEKTCSRQQGYFEYYNKEPLCQEAGRQRTKCYTFDRFTV